MTWVLFLEMEQTNLLILGFGIFEKVHSRPKIWSFEYEHIQFVKSLGLARGVIKVILFLTLDIIFHVIMPRGN